MSRQFIYTGEANGGRIIRHGVDLLTKVTATGTEPVLLALKTWDLVPSGEAGDNVFREVIATIRFTNGYHIRITPIVDGVDLAPQDFTDIGAGTIDCQAYVAVRGARIATIVEQITNDGPIELVNVQVAYLALRQVP